MFHFLCFIIIKSSFNPAGYKFSCLFINDLMTEGVILLTHIHIYVGYTQSPPLSSETGRISICYSFASVTGNHSNVRALNAESDSANDQVQSSFTLGVIVSQERTDESLY